ncbi:CLUMA_CG021240, isoform A [Clunio marinus]|uniref:CLUMA_CG021240, isoform A n=1 Tax=Clunio marinus TaxID=568069 RepID=A0A1J1J8C6_9DIPT|nr:CLUMA_CG021240, isoform A [Clunio marinus]
MKGTTLYRNCLVYSETMNRIWYSFLFTAIIVVGNTIAVDVANNTINNEVPMNSLSTNDKSTTKTDSTENKITVESHNNEADLGTKENPFDPSKMAKIPDENSIGNMKYYFILLVLSSLSVISVIIFKALRLRKSRAEIKYGASSAKDRSEVEPLGRSNWLEESSDENEDEIFDINFLKNTRTHTNKV